MAHRSQGELLQIIQITEKLKLILFTLLICVYAFVCICLTLFLGYISCIILIISFKNYPFQTITFILLAVCIYILLWSLLYIKVKLSMKFLIFILLLLFIRLLLITPAVEYAIDYDTCIDTGICKEGIQTKIDGGLTTVNKENCFKHNKKWYDSNNSCYVR